MKEQLTKLTVGDVNAAIHRHLKSERVRIVLVTKDADRLRDAIVKNTPSPIAYNSPKAEEILDEDKIIQSYKINVKSADVSVEQVGRIFE